ncbi:MAG: DUF255 domain-containing protein [Chitinophagales bacterium]|nr:DUF255 domain-containing protein [Chitinophagales bacterium]
MRHIILMLVAITVMTTHVFAGGNEKGGINWMTWDEVQVAMKKEPRKVWVDVYTDWCGWCKVMDKKTFSNPEVIKYMNKHFYAVKFNAEAPQDIMFQGTQYGMEGNVNKLASKLLNDNMSYPTMVIMEENFANPQPVPGYMPVSNIEMIMKYLGEGIYKTQKFEDYTKAFKPEWEKPEAQQG